MKRLFSLCLAVCLPIPVLFFLLTASVTAANHTFTVNSTADVNDANAGDGICDSDLAAEGEQCTLRAAISEANAAGDMVTITIPAGTYTLVISGSLEDANATGDLDIAGDMHFIGSGRAETIIQAGSTISDSVDRVFHILNSANNVSFSALTIQHGFIANSGTLTGQIDDGAGILVVGNPNTAVVVRDLLITHNQNADLREDGGGIANLGGGTVYIYDSFIISNSVRMDSGSSGAGLFSVFGSHMVVHNTVISGNVAGGKGGGLYNNRDGSTVRIVDSLIVDNYAADVGGGIQSGSIVYITNTTVSGNHSDLTGGGLSADSPNSEFYLYHVTIANNTADHDNNGEGSGGGLHLISGTVTMSNTIMAGNWLGDGTADDCDADSPINSSYSLIQTVNNCTITGTQNITSTAPRLRPLANHGGRTLTHAFANDSPLLNYIPLGINGCGTAVLTDQRGIARPFNTGCEPGAFEQVWQVALPLMIGD